MKLTRLVAVVVTLLPLVASAQAEPSLIPLTVKPGERIALIGNTLFDYMQYHGEFEAMLQQKFAAEKPVIRTLAWSADEITVRPRPEAFGDIHDHLAAVKADTIFAAYGFNESWKGIEKVGEFEKLLEGFIVELRSHKYNGQTAPRIYLVSPIAVEDLGKPLPGGRETNERLRAYTTAISRVADKMGVGFVDVFTPSLHAMSDTGKSGPLTFNSIHLNETGYREFAGWLFCGLTREPHPEPNPGLVKAVEDKNQQWFYRYRPLNGFYITGGRNKPYGVVNFPLEMEKLEQMVANRDKLIFDLASGAKVPPGKVDDSNTVALPKITGDRPINTYGTVAQELAAFKIDPRFEVTCFASEEDFPELTKPIQMRWDTKGRLWVSTSQTYPQVLPGEGPIDKILILEDTNGDGKADKCTVWADHLHIPLSFEFGDGGVYVSEQPHITFLKDTDGDGKADLRRIVLTGFGTEDSHHSLHDFTWTPDGDLAFRESIFLHTQVETPYGPVRARESSYYLFWPREQRLIGYGSYAGGTNPWGMTFDTWGRQMGSHPIFASAVQALNAPYPTLHVPAGNYFKAYSGTCGHEFIYSRNFSAELQGCFVKVRYKPTNEVEIHKWNETVGGFEEEIIGKVFQSTDLSFIPVDVRFGPRGDLYICDWYNPVKGHAQYSLRDTRRDKKMGRIWRVTGKGLPLNDAPKIAGEPIPVLLDLLKAYEYRTRYTAKIELRERSRTDVKAALDAWVKKLDPKDPEVLHHKLEALWLYRWLRVNEASLLRELLTCSDANARAAAAHELRWWAKDLPDGLDLLRKAANDEKGIVRLEAATSASYIGSLEAADAALDLLKHPMDPYLTYALRTSLDSMKPLWENNAEFRAAHAHFNHFMTSSDPQLQANAKARKKAAEKPNPFDKLNPQVIKIGTVPERMLFTVASFKVKAGEPVKLIFDNPDASCAHNLVIVQPGSSDEVGMAAVEMAKGTDGVAKGFIPQSDKIIAHTALINPGEQDILRFHAPKTPGTYPYICTFPGHWLVMKGEMIVE
jgi:uncharacterized cupredoxin-like copper-binding protein